ncbi:heparinase [Opitutaceae bacterium TAV5]|nr:heparinase [Opitutaceae bacterium TAV5]
MKALTLLAFPLLLACPLAAQPLDFPNPGFEEGTDGFARWTAPAADKGMSTTSAESARTGKLGLKVNDRSGSSGSSLYSTRIPVRPGRGYELSFSGRIVEGGGIDVYLQFFDTAGKLIPPGDRFVMSLRTAAATWTRHTLPAIAPEKAATAAVWIHSYNQVTVTALFDDFSLREISASDASAAIAARAGNSGRVLSANPLPDFPKPHPEKTFAEYKVLQPDGGVLRKPVEDWQGARQRVATDPAWAAWLKERRETTDAWITRHRDRVEWQTGYWHHFVSPKDGSFLEWTDDIPGEETDHLMSRSGHRVEITPDIFGGWVFGFRKRNFEQTVEAARLYRLTGETRYAEWAAGQLDFYANNYDRWGKNPRQRKGSHIGWQALEDATWLTLKVDAARLLFDYAGETRRQAWFAKLLKPQAELLTGIGQDIHNIPTWYRSSAAQVALLYKDNDLWNRTVDGKPYGLREQLHRGVTSDYFWYEQAMGYNAYIIVATRPLFTFAGLIGEGHRLRDEAAIAQNLVIAPLAIRFPDGTIPNPADSHRPARASANGLAGIYRILPTTLGLAAAADIRSWDTLVDPPPLSPQETPELPPVVSRHMESIRFALMKKGPWQVFFHYGQIHRSHSQSEALNWSASFEGVDVTHDPGTVGYGSPMHRGYYQRGLNHNIPLVNGEGQVPWDPGEMTLFDDARGVMTARQPSWRPDASASRTLRIDGDRLIDETTVTYTGTETAGATLSLSLHLHGTPKLPDIFKPVSGFATGRPAEFGYWEEVRSARFENEAVIDVVFPEGKILRVRFATPGAFTLWQGSSPDAPPDRRAGFYIEKTEPAREASFVTELAPAAP